MSRPIHAVVLALLLVGCASPPMWHRANTDADQAAFDLQTCRSLARARLQRDQAYLNDRAVADARAADEAGRGDGTLAVRQRWAEAGARQTVGRLIAGCMASKGYRSGPAPAPARST